MGKKNTAVLGKRLPLGVGLPHIVDLVHVQLGNGKPKVLCNLGKVFYRNVGILALLQLNGA